MSVEPLVVARALRGGVATLDALAARTGAQRDELVWALDEAAARGWVTAPQEDCGVCAGQPPVVYRLTDAGRRALGSV